MDPVRIPAPKRIESPRLILRPFAAGDGTVYNEAIRESYDTLKLWLPWARTPEPPTVEESEKTAQESAAKFERMEVFNFLYFEKPSGLVLGSMNLFCHDWNIPHFEIGYWIRNRSAGKGYVKEAALVLAKLAFEKFDAKRVQLRCDPRNLPSCAIAEALGFEVEGTLRNYFWGPDRRLCDTRIYARTSAAGLPSLDVQWF